MKNPQLLFGQPIETAKIIKVWCHDIFVLYLNMSVGSNPATEDRLLQFADYNQEVFISQEKHGIHFNQ